MAIVQASIQEEVLPRSERAVIRGIYHASQLSEALVALNKISDSMIDINRDARGQKINDNTNEHIKLMKSYLARQIASALVSTKIPAVKNEVSTSSNVQVTGTNVL